MPLLSIPNILSESMDTGVVDGAKICATTGVGNGIEVLECISNGLDQYPKHANIRYVSHTLLKDGVFLSLCESANIKNLVKLRVYVVKHVLHLCLCRLQMGRDPILCRHGVESTHASGRDVCHHFVSLLSWFSSE